MKYHFFCQKGSTKMEWVNTLSDIEVLDNTIVIQTFINLAMTAMQYQYSGQLPRLQGMLRGHTDKSEKFWGTLLVMSL